MNVLKTESLCVGYGSNPLIENVRLTLSAGTMFGIAGDNGTGKSTLLKTIAGIVPSLSGTVRFASNMCVGYVPQHATVDPVFPTPVCEVVDQGLLNASLPRKEHAAARDAVKEQFSLGSFWHQPFRSLSGGQKQKVLIARAMVRRPGCLLLDEPASGLDKTAAENLYKILSSLAETQQVAVLMVDHHLPELAAIAHLIGRIKNGTMRVSTVSGMETT